MKAMELGRPLHPAGRGGSDEAEVGGELGGALERPGDKVELGRDGPTNEAEEREVDAGRRELQRRWKARQSHAWWPQQR